VGGIELGSPQNHASMATRAAQATLGARAKPL